MNRRIAVAGANGHTGRFVTNELRRRGHEPVALTRSGEGGRRLDVGDQSSLDAALAGTDAVINCAGPFFDTAIPLAMAATRQGIHYLDVCAEQSTIAALADAVDGDARAAGVVVAPGMAFYGALADLMAASLITPGSKADRVDIAVALDSWHPTEGTRRTGARNTAPRLVIREGSLVPVENGQAVSGWDFPAPFGPQQVRIVPLAEMVLINRHLQVSEATSFMNLAPLRDLGDSSTPPPRAVDEMGRSAQQFVIDVRVVDGGLTRRAIASGRDIYAVSAPIVVNACDILIRGGHSHSGFRAPGEFLPVQAFLDALAPDIAIEWQSA